MTELEKRPGGHPMAYKLPQTKGSANPMAKLTEDDVAEIKRLLRTTRVSQVAIAKRFNVSHVTVNRINSGQVWGSVPWPEGEDAKKRGNLTADDARLIKALLVDGELTNEEIAWKFGIASSTVSHIKSGRTWDHVPWPTKEEAS